MGIAEDQLTSELDPQLYRQAQEFAYDPLGFVYWAFPWRQDGTILEDHDGPDVWQADVLTDLGEGLRRARDAGGSELDALATSIRIAVGSGHGVGKSGLIAWIILFMLSTRVAPAVVVTANTALQLSSKTWRELAKWHRLFKLRTAFQWTATKFYLKGRAEDWFAQAIPWSKERPEAFAGTHAQQVVVLFDESSAIDDVIWETTEGAMTDPGAVWIAFGNPTKNTGRFKECFPGGRFAHRWITKHVDSRACKMTNKAEIQQWIDDYGEDHDFVRVRVRGIFPRVGATQLIPNDIVDAARKRSPEGYENEPIVMGVDIARFGDDRTTITVRQGQAILRRRSYRGLDNMQVVGHVSREYDDLTENELEPDGLVMESAGVGAGPVDRLRQLGYKVIDINPGTRAIDDNKYSNLRTEMWIKIKTWLDKGGCLLADDDEMAADLIGPQYAFDAQNRLSLEKKKDMKKRGLASPDAGDSLAMTLAVPVRAKKKRRQGGIQVRPPTMDELIQLHEKGLKTDPDDYRI